MPDLDKGLHQYAKSIRSRQSVYALNGAKRAPDHGLHVRPRMARGRVVAQPVNRARRNNARSPPGPHDRRCEQLRHRTRLDSTTALSRWATAPRLRVARRPQKIACQRPTGSSLSKNTHATGGRLFEDHCQHKRIFKRARR